MRIVIGIVLLVLAWTSCKEKEEEFNVQTVDTPDDTISVEMVRYLALGDSYTIGQSVETEERWPVQLAEKLGDSGLMVTDLKIIAKTGWTTSELAQGIQSENPQGPYNLVSLLIGVNNQYRRLDTTEYRAEFKDLLQKAVGFAGGDSTRVIVVSIPDYSVMPFAGKLDTVRIAREIDAFNAINFDETTMAGIRYVDVTPISRLARENPVFIAKDGLHPSGRMYREWVKLIFPVSLDVLTTQDL